MVINNSDINKVENLYTDSKTKKSIFKKIEDIRKHFDDASRTLTLVFDKNIKEDDEFVHPLFLILLLNLKDKHYSDIKLILDIQRFSNKTQHYILIFLAQYIDYELLRVVWKNEEKEKEKISEHTINGTASKILLNCTVEPGPTLTKEKEYEFIPVVKITNPNNIDLDKFNEDKKDVEGDMHRKIIYKGLQIETEEKGIYKDKDSKTWDKIFNVYLNLEKDVEGLSTPLRHIIFECVDNIRKHTKKETSGHICFYRNRHNKTVELIVSDNYELGFLEAYFTTLKDEKIRLQSSVQRRYDRMIESGNVDASKLFDDKDIDELTKQYDDDIKALKKNTADGDKEVLEKLFDAKKTFGMHQARRIIMHFGIPTLMRLLKKLNGTLDIYLHRNNRYYRIQYKNGKTQPIDVYKPTVDKIERKGTYIYISFPSGKKTIDTNKPVQVNLKNRDYKVFFDKRNEYKRKISKFVLIDSSELSKEADEIKRILPSKSIVVDYNIRNKNDMVGKYLRDIYRYTYIADIHDVVVVNFPIMDYENYLYALINILYPDKETLYEGDTQLNIAFFDKYSNSIAFIGGENKNKFCDINSILRRNYNQSKIEFFKDVCEDLCEEDETHNSLNNDGFKISSKLFDNNEFLPFELFLNDSKTNKPLFATTLLSELENTKSNVHVDTRQGLHTNKFYNLKIAFEDSNWIQRISFYYATYLAEYARKKKIDAKDIAFIGLGKYAGSTLSTLKLLLGHKNDYLIYFQGREKNSTTNDNKQLEDFINRYKSKHIFLFAPNITSYKFTTDAINQIKQINKKNISGYFCSILLNENEVIPSDSRRKINYVVKKPYTNNEKQSAETCDFCFNDDVPLYEIENKGYSLENYYQGKHKDKLFTSKIKNWWDIDWQNIIYTGHIERSNHYYFYIKTIKLLKENKQEISKWISKEIKVDKNTRSFILAPVRRTNNDFIALVNEKVFGNNATVHYFDKKLGSQNLYNTKVLSDIQVNDKVYFVDDEIDTGLTLQHFYALLKFNREDGNGKFDGIITLVDRASRQDEENILNYLKDSKSDRFYAYINSNIKPIKKYDEGCFLCERRDYYIQMYKDSVLDSTRFEFLKRVVKLQTRKAIEIEDKKSEESVKDFIKFHLANYVLTNFQDTSFSKLKNESIENILMNYDNQISWIKSMEGINDEVFDNAIIKKITFQVEIGLIKALAFPNAVYYEEARKIVTSHIVKELKKYSTDKDFNIQKILSSVYEKDEKDLLESIEEDEDTTRNFIAFLKSDLLHLDYLNVLIATAGYLNINYLLTEEMLLLYCNLVIEIKKKDNKERENLLDKIHQYPFAVKMIASYSTFKAHRLDINIKSFLDGKKLDNVDESGYKNIKAIYLENIKATEVRDIQIHIGKLIEPELDNGDSFSRTEKLIEILKNIDTSLHIDDIALYVNKNFTLQFKDIGTYINKSTLIDIQSLEEISESSDNMKKDICMLYGGAVSNYEANTKIEKPLVEVIYDGTYRINRVWGNLHKGNRILIKLVSTVCDDKLLIDNGELGEYIAGFDEKYIGYINKTQAIVPIGILSITLSNLSMEKSTDEISKLTRNYLALNNSMVDYVKAKLNSYTFHEKLNSVQESLIHKDNLHGINHSFKDYIDVGKKIKSYMLEHTNSEKHTEYLTKLQTYTKGLYHLSSIFTIDKASKIENTSFTTDIVKVLNKNSDFFKEMKIFFKIANTFSSTNNLCPNCEENGLIDISGLSEESFNLSFVEDSDDFMEHICFEFIFNAMRRMKNVEEPYIKFSSLPNNDGIIIENKIDTNFDIIKFEENIKTGKQLGVKLIKSVVERQKYKMSFSPDLENMTFTIIIKKDNP